MSIRTRFFYWARTGNQPTVLETHCALAQDVEPQALREALLGALRTHTNFRVRPLVVQSKLLASIEDVQNPPLYENTGIARHLGTEETERLMFYVTYKKRVITLHVFHGLADLRGIYAFLNTLLGYYFNSPGLARTDLPKPNNRDTVSCYESILGDGAPGKAVGYYAPKKRDVFHLPEKSFGKRSTRQRVCEIDVPIEPLLALSKDSKSSVVPTLST